MTRKSEKSLDKNKKDSAISKSEVESQPKPPVNLLTHISWVDFNITASNVFRKIKKTTNIYFVLKSPINSGKFKKDGSWEDIELMGSVSGIIANGGLFVQGGAAGAFADATAIVGIASYIHKKAAETHPPTPGYKELYCSQVFKKTPHGDTRLESTKFRVGFYDLCGGDLDKKFLFEIYHFKKIGASVSIGSLNVSINDLRKQSVIDLRSILDKNDKDCDKIGAKLFIELVTSAPLDIPQQFLYPCTVTPPIFTPIPNMDNSLTHSMPNIPNVEGNKVPVIYPSYSMPTLPSYQQNGATVHSSATLTQSVDYTVHQKPNQNVAYHGSYHAHISHQHIQQYPQPTAQHQQPQQYPVPPQQYTSPQAPVAKEAPRKNSKPLPVVPQQTVQMQPIKSIADQHPIQPIAHQQPIQPIAQPQSHYQQPPPPQQQFHHYSQQYPQQYSQQAYPQQYPYYQPTTPDQYPQKQVNYNEYQHSYYPPQQTAPTNITPPLPHHIPIDNSYSTQVSK